MLRKDSMYIEMDREDIQNIYQKLLTLATLRNYPRGAISIYRIPAINLYIYTYINTTNTTTQATTLRKSPPLPSFPSSTPSTHSLTHSLHPRSPTSFASGQPTCIRWEGRYEMDDGIAVRCEMRKLHRLLIAGCCCCCCCWFFGNRDVAIEVEVLNHEREREREREREKEGEAHTLHAPCSTPIDHHPYKQTNKPVGGYSLLSIHLSIHPSIHLAS